jgi:hypothetical protein
MSGDPKSEACAPDLCGAMADAVSRPLAIAKFVMEFLRHTCCDFYHSAPFFALDTVWHCKVLLLTKQLLKIEGPLVQKYCGCFRTLVKRIRSRLSRNWNAWAGDVHGHGVLENERLYENQTKWATFSIAVAMPVPSGIFVGARGPSRYQPLSPLVA